MVLIRVEIFLYILGPFSCSYLQKPQRQWHHLQGISFNLYLLLAVELASSLSQDSGSLFPVSEQEMLIRLEYLHVRNTLATLILPTEFSVKQKFVRAICRFAVVCAGVTHEGNLNVNI
jgi:hypothetical protein